MRVYKKKYYILQRTPGISGFQKWGEKEFVVCTGLKAMNNKSSIIKEFSPNGKGKFRLEDGHLPSHQPKAEEEGALNWLNIKRRSYSIRKSTDSAFCEI